MSRYVLLVLVFDWENGDKDGLEEGVWLEVKVWLDKEKE